MPPSFFLAVVPGTSWGGLRLLYPCNPTDAADFLTSSSCSTVTCVTGRRSWGFAVSVEPDRVSQPHDYGKQNGLCRRCAGGMSLARDGKRSCVLVTCWNVLEIRKKEEIFQTLVAILWAVLSRVNRTSPFERGGRCQPINSFIQSSMNKVTSSCKDTKSNCTLQIPPAVDTCTPPCSPYHFYYQ